MKGAYPKFQRFPVVSTAGKTLPGNSGSYFAGLLHLQALVCGLDVFGDALGIAAGNLQEDHLERVLKSMVRRRHREHHDDTDGDDDDDDDDGVDDEDDDDLDGVGAGVDRGRTGDTNDEDHDDEANYDDDGDDAGCHSSSCSHCCCDEYHWDCCRSCRRCHTIAPVRMMAATSIGVRVSE